jgi:hypothetical protein
MGRLQSAGADPTAPRLVATGTFETRVVIETVYGLADCGVVSNELRLYAHTDGTYVVEWDAANLDTVEIGIRVDHRTEPQKVTDYDGVFSLPTEVAAFLRRHNFDTTEVEV